MSSPSPVLLQRGGGDRGRQWAGDRRDPGPGVPRVSLMSRRPETLEQSRQRAARYVATLHQRGYCGVPPETLPGAPPPPPPPLTTPAAGTGFVIDITEDAGAPNRKVFARLDALLPPWWSRQQHLPPPWPSSPRACHPERVLISHFISRPTWSPVLEVVQGEHLPRAWSGRSALWRPWGGCLLMQRTIQAS